MNRYAGFTLLIAAMFLIIMAILVNSPALFYMTTAALVTLGVSRLQAFLAVRGLRFERYVTPAVEVGETVTVEILAWSKRKLRRPLITVFDILPRRLMAELVQPSLPIAPSFEQPIMTRYSFRPLRRGKFRWARLRVQGCDALGLISQERTYEADPVELTVYPRPIPVSVDLRPRAGWGNSDLESGRTRGPGLEPRGVREYSPGDPLRFIHWKSSARAGRLMVKEFDMSSGVAMYFLMQQTIGTDIGKPPITTTERICGNALFLAEKFLRQGATVHFPGLESRASIVDHPDQRLRDIRECLTFVQADKAESISQTLAAHEKDLPIGCSLVLMLSVQDPDLPIQIAALPHVHTICMTYDALEYARPGLGIPHFASAADPAYLARIEAAGADIVVVPVMERVG